jgi:hypothetical protein
MDFSITAGSTLRPPTFWKKLGRPLSLRPLIFLALAAASAWPAELRAQSAILREYEIKAAYLYNFIRYIDWPADTLPPAGGTITIGILGDNLFGPAIVPLNGKPIKGRTLAVKQITAPKDMEECQIVFICASEKARLAEILGQLKESKALTVSEIDGFASQGGIINFIYERNKVRFEINPDAARRTGLTLSSELLKLARLVKS